MFFGDVCAQSRVSTFHKITEQLILSHISKTEVTILNLILFLCFLDHILFAQLMPSRAEETIPPA